SRRRPIPGLGRGGSGWSRTGRGGARGAAGEWTPAHAVRPRPGTRRPPAQRPRRRAAGRCPPHASPPPSCPPPDGRRPPLRRGGGFPRSLAGARTPALRERSLLLLSCLAAREGGHLRVVARGGEHLSDLRPAQEPEPL